MRPYFYGYRIVAAGFVTQAVTVGAMFTYGVFFKVFQGEFGWSRAIVSGASSLAFLVMGAAAVLAGGLNNKLGPRLLMSVSAVFIGVGYCLMAFMDSAWQLYLFYGVVVGIGYCTHDVVLLSTVARWFVARRGMMSGIVKVGTGVGQFIAPLAAASLLAAIGWRQAYLLIGAASMLVLVLVAQVMRRDPADLGLQPAHGMDAQQSSFKVRPPDASFAAATRSRHFWTLCLAEFLIFFCLFTVVVHIVAHGQDSGLASSVAAAILSTIGAVSMVGRVTMGHINDKIGGRSSLLICFLMLISGLACLQIETRPWTLFAFAVIYGFAHGGFFTVMSPTVAELYGTRSHGQLFGIVWSFGCFGGSIGPILTGYLFDSLGSYRIAFNLLTLLALIGFFLIFSIKTPPAAAVERCEPLGTP